MDCENDRSQMRKRLFKADQKLEPIQHDVGAGQPRIVEGTLPVVAFSYNLEIATTFQQYFQSFAQCGMIIN